jgi:MerR family transcriptional regulator, light-induced transcriptional regulator
MSLLNTNLSKEFNQAAKRIYDQQFLLDNRLESEYDDYRKKKMYEDILYNLSFLEVSYDLEDNKLFGEYAIWLYELMMNLMPDITPERIKQQMLDHYDILSSELESILPEKKYAKIKTFIDKAKNKTINYVKPESKSSIATGKYGIIKQTYLNYLLEEDAKKAIDYIVEMEKINIPLEDIYVDILQEVMIEIGSLWHQNKITVDQEHYMTSITQMVLSQFYNKIFSTARNNLSLLACSVGSELHEMGARMISDLFEYNGWDSLYLGAAIPTKVLIKKISLLKPNLVILSVTMPQHLTECFNLVKEIKKIDSSIKVAVGGRAFQIGDEIWKKWPVDISVSNAKNLLEWANKEF